jgi:amidohydrolase
MNITVSEIKAKANDLNDWLLNVRRHLHQHPELSFHEHKTSDYIATQLEELGIPFKRNIAGTGILAHIKGKAGQGKCIALRADMDALPITEDSGCSFSSVNEGVMHACGHDIHTTCLLGAAQILNELKANISGTILLIFQPGEEVLPGGASLMLNEGMFDTFEPELILGLHVQPNIATGSVGFRPGMYMASSDELYLTVNGKGGHGAMPYQTTDPVLATAHILVALQQIVSRNANVAIPTVLSFGKVIANGATNVIPSEVKCEGTFRTMNEEWRKDAHQRMKKMAAGIAESMGCTANLHIENGYPVLVNDVAATNNAIKYATELLGNDKVEALDLRMTSEDFAYYAIQYPAVFFRLGVEPEDGKSQPLHSSKFVANENALAIGAATMSWLALNFVKS